MKKIILSALVLCAFSFNANAQKPELKLGAKAGLNVSSISGDGDSSSRTGFNVGVVAEYFVTEKFSIQPEILYSAQGAKYEFTEIINTGVGIPQRFTVKETMKLDYINVPIMAKYYVFDGLNVQAGPQIGFLASAKDGSVNIKDEMKSVDFSLNLGAGYELPMGVFFDARYNIGLTDVAKKVEGEKIKSKNGVFQVSVGYKF
ncbi:Outer membrane protein beta-barrel domain-containing protein [Myroides marinus]|uniref:Outer membrane protein beta-barrel domain-containing protein n=1 Tax=Myroides marinus TaxID=703342 RepID=A0A1H6W1K0_9FLAO|nr:porin family protein [Myroides marinus]SEJ10763.1 Outer membrane protein beta-barrel domain-containing protein [Myroides marinus]